LLGASSTASVAPQLLRPLHLDTLAKGKLQLRPLRDAVNSLEPSIRCQMAPTQGKSLGANFDSTSTPLLRNGICGERIMSHYGGQRVNACYVT